MTLTCFFVLLILGGELYVLYRWRRSKFPRPGWMFGLWAPAVYALGLLLAWVIGWGLSYVLVAADPSAAEMQSLLFGLIVLTGIVLAVVVALTLFFNWVLNTDMGDVPK